MPASRGNNPDGASAERLAAWLEERSPVLRELRARRAGYDSALPVDMLADIEATRRAIDDLR